MGQLHVKYGLGDGEPTVEQEKRWIERTEQLISEGLSKEKAGAQAASEIFRTFQKFIYDSYADTLHDLLAAIKAKHGK